MLRFGVDAEVACGLLRSYSNQHNIKLATLAGRMVAGFTDPMMERRDPLEGQLDLRATSTASSA